MRLPGTTGRQRPADAQRPTPAADTGAAPAKKKPLYVRLLRLRHVHPSAWQRAALGEGALALAVVLVLADVASAWTLVVLPVAVALVVKAHDVLAGWLAQPTPGQDTTSPDTAGSDTAGPDTAGPDTTTAPTPEGTGAVGRRRG